MPCTTDSIIKKYHLMRTRMNNGFRDYVHVSNCMILVHPFGILFILRQSPLSLTHIPAHTTHRLESCAISNLRMSSTMLHSDGHFSRFGPRFRVGIDNLPQAPAMVKYHRWSTAAEVLGVVVVVTVQHRTGCNNLYINPPFLRIISFCSCKGMALIFIIHS